MKTKFQNDTVICNYISIHQTSMKSIVKIKLKNFNDYIIVFNI